MIQVYYGNGKGKTSAAVGAAIRAAGSGMKVLFTQFLKNGDSCECNVLRNTENIDFLLPNDKYILFEKPDSERIKQRSLAYNGFIFGQLSEIAKDYQMIVFDEVLDIMEFGYITEERFIYLLNDLKIGCEIVLTGRNITESIYESADYISNIKEEKHPYSSGTAPRRGVEY